MIEIPQEIQKTLREIGLDRTEIQVYILLLKQGLLSINDITKELKLPRSSVHLTCENLLKKDILKTSTTGKRRYFYVENPKDIENIINIKKNKIEVESTALHSILPKLISINSIAKESETIEIKELNGKEGFLQTFYESLDQKKGSEILRFGGDPKLFTIGRDELKKYREKRNKKGIYTRMLQPKTEYSDDEIKDAMFKMREVRILDKNIYDPTIRISTWQNKTSITVWDKGLHSVIITNSALSSFMKQMFEICWDQAEK